MTENTIQVQALSAGEALAASETLAMESAPEVAPAGEDFVELVEVTMPADGPPQGPVFGPQNEPVAAGTTYQALGGTHFYRPLWRILDRDKSMVPGPNVWFHKDNQGAITLIWTMADEPPAGAPPGAKSLAKSIDSVTVRWNGGQHVFPRPRLGRRMSPEVREAWTVLELGAALLPDDARKLELAMSDAASGCRLEIVHTAYYLVLPPEPVGRPSRIWMLPGDRQEQLDELNRVATESFFLHLEDGYWWVLVMGDGDLASMEALVKAAGVEIAGQDTLKRWQAELGAVLGAERFAELAGLPEPYTLHDVQETQSIPFVFNPNDDQNRLIYRALHGAADLTDEWRKSAAGWLRDSGFPNTVYRLPDEIRLAFDPSLGTPHVVVTLHQDGQSSTSVRVLLRVAPWQDPRKVLETRELVHSDAARVIVGPVEGASLRLGGSFPESVRLLGGEVSVPLSEGADLLLDLSLEYFQLLCGMLGGAVGLPGEVTVTLGEVTAPIPVSLRMDKVNDLPVGVEVIGTGSPTSVRVTNKSGTAIRVGGCHGVLLQVDESSVVPVASYRARCTSSFPLELAKDATAELTFEPVDLPAGASWNAVLVELLDKMLVDDAKTLLVRANELAGSGELTWDVVVSSPVLAAALPPRWANLTSIEVEVSAPGFDTTTVVLRVGTASKAVTMRKPLSELVVGAAGGIQTATYRVRNNYVDHQGQWTEYQEQSGEELVVYPNPAPGD